MSKAITRGVHPLSPVFFYDFDDTPIFQIRAFAMQHFGNFDIYGSSPNKYHLVAKCRDWDIVQRMLWETHNQFPWEHYILNCRKLRLRTAPKILEGFTVCEAPELFECHCVPFGQHHEKRIGIEQDYETEIRER